MRVLIVGCGYVGLPLGAELARQGYEVFGLRRTTATAGQLRLSGIHPLHGDITRPQELAKLPAPFDWVVNCVATAGGGVEDYRRVYSRGTRNLISWLSATAPRKFVYTSSTSVYGQNDGSWVDETSPVDPAAATAQVLAETEKTLLAAARRDGFPAVILRVAGIYGPDRGHWLKSFLKNEARIDGNGERVLNMIHRDDVVGATIAALKHGAPGAIYNAVDDEPVGQIALFKWLAEALRQRLPPSVPEKPDARKRGVTNKRVSNRKLKVELGYQFKHPTFRDGYAAEIQRLNPQRAFDRGSGQPQSN